MARRHTYRARPSLREGCGMIASIVILSATALCRGADARGQLGRSLDARLSLEPTDATRRQVRYFAQTPWQVAASPPPCTGARAVMPALTSEAAERCKLT